MARYTSDSKERVREAVDMVDLVGTRTELRRSGADSYVGLCPFHEERTPSFGIRPSGKVYYCFGCQAAGDAFSFVMETEGLEFVAAMEYLAERYGVTLELADEDPRAANERRRQARLLELLERTCSYYERVLWDHSEGARAREYLAGRGLEEAVLREFRVGFAPSAWDRVLLGSRRSGFSEAELLAAGVVQRSRDRPGSVYDRFRRRITFPLCDQRGHVLGFGARAMGSDQQPKYVNSADGAIYHKGRHLFGTHLARSHAAKAGAIVLCEGYTDVIAAHQAGVRNCVGLMGTALTEEQVGELARLAPSVVLALDADGAGQEAMMKASRLAGKQRFELRVAALPPGSDPAEVLERDGPEAVRALLGASLPFVRFRVERILGGERDTPEARDRILEQLPPGLRGARPRRDARGAGTRGGEPPERLGEARRVSARRPQRRRTIGRSAALAVPAGFGRAHRAHLPRAVHRPARAWARAADGARSGKRFQQPGDARRGGAPARASRIPLRRC